MWRLCKKVPVGVDHELVSNWWFFTLRGAFVFQMCFAAVSCGCGACNSLYWELTVKETAEPAFQITWSGISWNVWPWNLPIKSANIWSLVRKRGWQKEMAQLLSQASLSAATSKGLGKTILRGSSPNQQSFQNFTEVPCPQQNLNPILKALNVLSTPWQKCDTLPGNLSCRSSGLQRW